MPPSRGAGAGAGVGTGADIDSTTTPTVPQPLHGRRFYLDVRVPSRARRLQQSISTLGGTVEIFLARTVTHVVTDNPKCALATQNGHGSTEELPQTADRSVSSFSAKWGGVGYRSRTDAMLESVYSLQQPQSPSVLQQARLWNIPVWTYKKVERFLSEINALVQRRVDLNVKVFRGSYIKFESSDRKNRSVYKEFAEWPNLYLAKEHLGSPFTPPDPKSDKKKSNTPKDDSQNHRGRPHRYTNCEVERKNLDSNLRMTRKTRPRLRERVDIPPKQNGYCEICRASYSVLSDHERTSSHINFVKNCSNFLSLDSLINDGTDVDTFLKMNKSNISNNCCERRSQRNLVKINHELESQNIQKHINVLCNGNSDTGCKDMSPKEKHALIASANDKGHFLRSKGSNANEPENHQKTSPRDISKRDLRNGSLSPRINSEKHYTSGKINGKIDDRDICSPLIKNSKARSIRWRRPSPDSNPAPPDNQTYYKVVGMSTKLRSSSNFIQGTHRESEPAHPPPTRVHCNGDADTGLVVKFRRVRRSELSVLSDEAENFMFPKKDDSDSTEDEVETSHYSNNESSSELLSSSQAGIDYRVKEEILSGDDMSQDSCASDSVHRKSRRRTHTESSTKNDQTNGNHKSKRHSLSKSPESSNKNKTDLSNDGDLTNHDDLPPREKCLKWVDGRLKTSPEVENLTYTFEKIPSYEPWYDTFKRQDEGKEKSHSIAEYLGYYWKSPILPYEMGTLPPLKPNCCQLSQLRRPIEVKSGPSRLYGTRGMKKRKIKQEIVFSPGKRPRKSPREHASTLAILGSLIHKRRSKLSSSDDTKSLPSIAEEEVSSDIPLILKLPEITVSESSKRLEEFFSTMRDDEEYDTLVDNLEQSVNIEKAASKPNILDLLQNYDQCDIIENTVKEIQENIQQRDGRRRRKGYKFKKKNKTGWPAKKKVQAKREIMSLAESVDSSCDINVPTEEPTSESQASPNTNQSKESSPKKTKTQNNINGNYLVLNSENSITSVSDVDDKASVSSKCKVSSDSECSNSEDEVLSSRSKRWRRSENSKEMQPVVRVHKIDAKSIDPGGRRRLRSSGPQRKLRGRVYR